MGIQFPEGFVLPGEEQPVGNVQPDFREDARGIVSRVAYLIGVPKKIFEKQTEPPEMEVYRQLETNKNARIIRNLCMLRTAIEQNYDKLYKRMRYDLKNLHTLPELIPQECLNQLELDGISIVRANAQPNQYIIELNKLISNRINNCEKIFPVWLKWPYIRELFLMPGGTTEDGIKAAAAEYYANKSGYPYQVYMNWPVGNDGNILYTDAKFTRLLYEIHEDYFADTQKVKDAGLKTKNSIYDFLDRAEKAAIVVDCENSDPYKLYAMLNNLDQEALLDKICKIILYNDVHTATAWKILDQFTEIPIEHIMIERLVEAKSLADVMLTAGTCREYYTNGTSSFLLASSDSDFWGLISSMPELDFLVLVESRKFGTHTKTALENAGITYCYLDDFCTGNSNEIQVEAVLTEVRKALDKACDFNIDEIMRVAYTATRVEMSQNEKKQLYNRYIKPMKLVIDRDGDVSIQLGE